MPRPRLLITSVGTIDLDARHPSVAQIAQYFEHQHLPEDLQRISSPFMTLAVQMMRDLPDSAELTTGLRKLLEAKDCFVRSAVTARPEED